MFGMGIGFGMSSFAHKSQDSSIDVVFEKYDGTFPLVFHGSTCLNFFHEQLPNIYVFLVITYIFPIFSFIVWNEILKRD